MARRYQFKSGILDLRQNWVWQGYVIASTDREAESILKKFKVKKRFPKSYEGVVLEVDNQEVNLKKGVYNLPSIPGFPN